MMRALTLGIAASAEWEPSHPFGIGSEAIVLVSDREYEDEDGARAESPVPKRRALIERVGPGRCGWYCLFSTADLTEIDDFVRHFRQEGDVLTFQAGHQTPTTDQLMTMVERVYRAVRQRRGEDGFSSDVIVAGFDEYKRPTIFQIGASGRAESRAVPGYALTGTGASHAGPHLYWHDLQPNDPLHHVLYKCWSAKRHAERIVGPTTDVAVLISGHEGPIDVSRTVRVTIEKALGALEAPVFAPRRPRERPSWREDLEKQVKEMLEAVDAADRKRFRFLEKL